MGQSLYAGYVKKIARKIKIDRYNFTGLTVLINFYN